MSRPSKPVVFWAWKDRPSFAMRGRQVAEALAKAGYQTEVRTGPSPIALRGIKDSIIFCVKSRPGFGGWLRRRKNRIVYDAIDFTAFRGVPSVAEVVLAGSEDMRRRLEGQMGSMARVRTVYHHADPNLQPQRAGEKDLRLVYIGEPESSHLINGEIPELHLVSFKKERNWRDAIRDYNAHFSARLDPNKSVIKLANVAVLQAVLLGGAEPGCVELLGKDYPFFLKDPTNLQAVREDVARLKAAIGTSVWKEARNRIEAVRSRLSIEATVKAYGEVIDELS